MNTRRRSIILSEMVASLRHVQYSCCKKVIRKYLSAKRHNKSLRPTATLVSYSCCSNVASAYFRSMSFLDTEGIKPIPLPTGKQVGTLKISF